VLLPAIGAAVQETAKPKVSSGGEWHFDGTVLVVDDEPAVRSLAREILEDAGASVVSAENGYDALREFESRSSEFRAILLDLTMPGLDGAEVFQRLIQIDPFARVILCSGYDEQDVSQKCGPIPPAGFLRKPFTRSDLVTAFRSVFA
jgi:CheY-like chemotaxis protein